LPDYTTTGEDTGENRGYVTLGCNGNITLKFEKTFVDGEGADIHIFEIGSMVEPTKLEISADGNNWITYGTVEGGTASVDIQSIAVAGIGYRYVRLTDVNSSCSGDYPGADLDAVLILNCGLDTGFVAQDTTMVPDTNTAPVAEAGSDEFVIVDSLVTLDGSGSSDADDDSLMYTWVLLSQPENSTATLSDESSSAPTFTPDLSGDYEFTLLVDDGTDSSNTDTLVISAGLVYTDGQGNEVTTQCGTNAGGGQIINFTPGTPGPPTGSDTPQQALGLPDHTTLGEDTGDNRGYVTLGCNGSITIKFERTFFDGDGADIHIFEIGSLVEPTNLEISTDGNNWITYGTVQGGTAAIDIEGIADPDVDYQYIRLSDIASECSGQWPGADLDAVLVLNCGEDTGFVFIDNFPPVADAGADKNVISDSLVTLDGSGSSDAEDDSLSFTWELVSQPDSSSASLSKEFYN